MGMARDQHERLPAREPGFVRKLIATFGLRAKHLTKAWSPLFSLTAALGVGSFVLELCGTDVPVLWYIFLLVVAVGTVAQELIYALRHDT